MLRAQLGARRLRPCPAPRSSPRRPQPRRRVSRPKRRRHAGGPLEPRRAARVIPSRCPRMTAAEDADDDGDRSGGAEAPDDPQAGGDDLAAKASAASADAVCRPGRGSRRDGVAEAPDDPQGHRGRVGIARCRVGGRRARRPSRRRRSAARRARRPTPATPDRPGVLDQGPAVGDFRTVGQPAAVTAVRAMLRAGMPHAVLLAGPGGVGKTTLGARRGRCPPVLGRTGSSALPDLPGVPDGRPRQSPRPPPPRALRCRCRDLHRRRGPSAGVRDLIGRPRPPARRGRRAGRDRAGRRPDDRGCPVGLPQDARGAARRHDHPPVRGRRGAPPADDPLALRPRPARADGGPRRRGRSSRARASPTRPTAARLARITDGRPGDAVAYALAPEAVTIRAEVARTLLDLLGAGRHRPPERRPRSCRAGRGTGARARARGRPRRSRREADAPSRTRGGARKAGRSGGRSGARPPADAASALDEAEAPDGTEPVAGEPAVRVPAAERRRGALALVAIWRAVLRDLALVARAPPASVRDLALLDDLRIAAGRWSPEAARRSSSASSTSPASASRATSAPSSSSTSLPSAGRPPAPMSSAARPPREPRAPPPAWMPSFAAASRASAFESSSSGRRRTSASRAGSRTCPAARSVASPRATERRSRQWLLAFGRVRPRRRSMPS